MLRQPNDAVLLGQNFVRHRNREPQFEITIQEKTIFINISLFIDINIKK